MEDLGVVECKTPSNRGDQLLLTSTAFDVTKGEEAPEIGHYQQINKSLLIGQKFQDFLKFFF